MTTTDGATDGPRETYRSLPADADLLADTARSILACPESVELVVDGLPLELDEAGPEPGAPGAGAQGARAQGAGAAPGLRDREGVPTFVCGIDSALSFAGAAGHSALVKLTSGLGPRGSEDRALVLSIAGRLRTAGREACSCCAEVRDVVVLDPGFVLLARPAADARAEERARVPLGVFRATRHHLNRGHLQRSAEHANDCHQDELRRAVAASAGTRFGDVAGVQLADLSRSGAQLRWVDRDGAHERAVTFPRPASTPDDLAELLRRQLHPGIC